MEVIIIGVTFYGVLFLALIAFIKSRIEPHNKKIKDLDSRII